MKKQILQLLVVLLVASPVIALAQAPKEGVYFSKEAIDGVLKAAVDSGHPGVDHTIKVIDMGKYQLSVAVIHRGPTGGGAAAAASAPAKAPTPAPVNTAPSCGESRPGAKGAGGIAHDDTAEGYVVISGSATLITGGTILNGHRSQPGDEVNDILNGPSCSGVMVGYKTRDVKVGDVIIIPEGVPHGFSSIPTEITYLSIRPDLKKVLKHGYVNPGFKE